MHSLVVQRALNKHKRNYPDMENKSTTCSTDQSRGNTLFLKQAKSRLFLYCHAQKTMYNTKI